MSTGYLRSPFVYMITTHNTNKGLVCRRLFSNDVQIFEFSRNTHTWHFCTTSNVNYQVVKASPRGSLHMIEPLAVASKGARHGARQGARQVHSLLLPLPHMVEVTLNSSMVVGTLKSSMKCYMYNVDFHDFSHHRTYNMVWNPWCIF